MAEDKVIIIGGGLGGLIASLRLAQAGIPSIVIEKHAYPQQRVCGEYISHEVTPFLRSLGVYPESLHPAQISRFQLSSVTGRSALLPLDLGGFGVSRYAFDHFLYTRAREAGVEFLLDTEVVDVQLANDRFEVKTADRSFDARVVIGAFGKRSRLDVQLKRSFVQKRSPYVGVKYHVRVEHPHDLIALHNFPGGYCGMSHIEDGKVNLCYLTHRDNLKAYGNIRAMEQAVLYQNPLLRDIFMRADFLSPKPETINEISFETKQPVEDHILMVGDAAGMITPLCGNGMAMAIRSAKILTDLLIPYYRNAAADRAALEELYTTQWRAQFAAQLWRGRQIQRLFGSESASRLAVNLVLHVRPLARAIVRSTHGDVFG
jgi:menaquinone-9 beta-reductase